jgi:hypothetical protein
MCTPAVSPLVDMEKPVYFTQLPLDEIWSHDLIAPECLWKVHHLPVRIGSHPMKISTTSGFVLESVAHNLFVSIANEGRQPDYVEYFVVGERESATVFQFERAHGHSIELHVAINKLVQI